MRYFFVATLLLLAPVSFAEWAEAVTVGSPFPNIQAVDQYGNKWNSAALKGEQGLLLFFNRSTLW